MSTYREYEVTTVYTETVIATSEQQAIDLAANQLWADVHDFGRELETYLGWEVKEVRDIPDDEAEELLSSHDPDEEV